MTKQLLIKSEEESNPIHHQIFTSCYKISKCTPNFINYIPVNKTKDLFASFLADDNREYANLVKFYQPIESHYKTLDYDRSNPPKREKNCIHSKYSPLFISFLPEIENY